jgi:hypothetical protein
MAGVTRSGTIVRHSSIPTDLVEVNKPLKYSVKTDSTSAALD